MDLDHMVRLMRRLALEAGDTIMEVYDGPDFEVKAKGDASP
jgi:3'(2'), 5'-bisphosphate nucleotidase